MLSVVSTSWVYWEHRERDPALLRRWVHGVQLLYKSTPLFLMGMAVALVGVRSPCTTAGWGQRIGTSLSVFGVVLVFSYLVFFWWLEKQQEKTTAKQGVKPVASKIWRF